MQSALGDYPLQGTRAQVMLETAMKAAQAAGRSQRDVAGELGYKSSVVLSHMTAGRVPVPIDRAKDIAAALGLDPNNFLLAVLEQRFPEVDFTTLFNISYSSEKTVRRLESIAGCSLDELPAETRAVLEEVVAARNPRRRWLAPAELTTIEFVRDLRPDSTFSGLTDEDRRSIEKALRP
jgi:transcriptional regulator with XRE-family HTH domain